MCLETSVYSHSSTLEVLTEPEEAMDDQLKRMLMWARSDIISVVKHTSRVSVAAPVPCIICGSDSPFNAHDSFRRRLVNPFVPPK